MTDIYFGVAIIGLLSLGVFWLATVLAMRLPVWLGGMLGPATLLAMTVYIRDIWDNPFLARLLPYSNVIILGNWFPLAMCFLAGLAWKRLRSYPVRRSAYVAILVAIGGYSLYYPLQGVPPHCLDVWRDGVSIQTTWNTCSAASAATLLKSYQIPASEGEMARLCLTRRGTYWQGLYRGLKLKTEGTPWNVEAFSCEVDDLRRMVLEGPLILTVQLDQEPATDPRYREEWGWVPGVSHSVVLFRFREFGNVDIADPANGIERWRAEDLRLLWHGKGIRLVHRSTHPM